MLNKFKIRTKLISSFLIVAIIAGVIGYIGFVNIHQIDNDDTKLYEKCAVPLGQIANIEGSFNRTRLDNYQMVLATDISVMKHKMERIDTLMKEIHTNLQGYSKTLLDSADEANYNKMKTLIEAYDKLSDKLFEMKLAGKEVEAKSLLDGEFQKRGSEISNYLHVVSALNVIAAKQTSDDNTVTANNASMTMVILIGVGVLLALALGFFLSNSMSKAITIAVVASDKISNGDFDVNLESKAKDETGTLLQSMKKMKETISSLIEDTANLSQAAIAGKLDTRANANKYEGEYRNLVSGINGTLDAVIGPLNVAAEYVDRISKGDIPPRITDEYKGDFNELKNNLNGCIDAVGLLVKDARMLATAAVEGKLDTRADASKHQGDFKGIVEGVNATLNNVIGPLNVAAEYVDRISKGDIPPRITDEYKGDFNEIKNNLNVCIDAVGALVKDTKDLSIAAVEGKLKTRADASKHQGDFRAIVQGVNETLDSVITPINESAGVLAEMAHGNLTKRMVGQYNGDMDEFKTSINQLGESLNNVLSEVLSSVTTTSAAAIQISATADGLAAASEEQSSQADEVASAVEEMSRTITENAMSASRTAEVAEKNGEIAKEGGDVVAQTVTKMKDIADVVKKSADNIEKLGESSKEIGEIISVIDDIADQTNLLALNAAIEAARAGEQGRGFAVVADEVRKLAERTTEATKQIAKMIKGIQGETQEAVEAMKKGNEEVKSGISLADRAGKSLQEIVTSSRDVQDMISQIASASEEQSSTSEEIAKNVAAISMVTNDSTKQIHEVASSADGLAKLTEQLQQMVGQFKLDSDVNSSQQRKLNSHSHQNLLN